MPRPASPCPAPPRPAPPRHAPSGPQGDTRWSALSGPSTVAQGRRRVPRDDDSAHGHGRPAGDGPPGGRAGPPPQPRPGTEPTAPHPAPQAAPPPRRARPARPPPHRARAAPAVWKEPQRGPAAAVRRPRLLQPRQRLRVLVEARRHRRGHRVLLPRLLAAGAGAVLPAPEKRGAARPQRLLARDHGGPRQRLAGLGTPGQPHQALDGGGRQRGQQADRRGGEGVFRHGRHALQRLRDDQGGHHPPAALHPGAHPPPPQVQLAAVTTTVPTRLGLFGDRSQLASSLISLLGGSKLGFSNCFFFNFSVVGDILF